VSNEQQQAFLERVARATLPDKFSPEFLAWRAAQVERELGPVLRAGQALHDDLDTASPNDPLAKAWDAALAGKENKVNGLEWRIS
jgi:hypothetical protein